MYFQGQVKYHSFKDNIFFRRKYCNSFQRYIFMKKINVEKCEVVKEKNGITQGHCM